MDGGTANKVVLLESLFDQAVDNLLMAYCIAHDISLVKYQALMDRMDAIDEVKYQQFSDELLDLISSLARSEGLQ